MAVLDGKGGPVIQCNECGRRFDVEGRVFCPCGVIADSQPSPAQRNAGKPGTELTRLIPSALAKHGCGCKDYARKMDRWGVDGCEARFTQIVDHLVDQAAKRHIPELLCRPVARTWLRRAIAVAKAIENPIQPATYTPTDSRWAVAVTTSPRRDCTLRQCIASIRACGWEPVIFAEPGSTKSDAFTITNESRKGVWHNWLASARWALDNTESELILTVQDDSLFHPESKSFVDSIQWPSKDAAFLSLYTPKHYTIRGDNVVRPPGINRIATRALWGACALVWKRDVLRQVIDHTIAKGWTGARPRSGSPSVIQSRRDNPHTIANSDTAIGKIVNSLCLSMWFVDPSPVQHIARHSTIGHGDNTGRRNAWRIADHGRPLAEQVPAPKAAT